MIFKLREIREKKGIPMKQMADELGIALSTLSQIEKCNIKVSIDKLEPIANILDVNISELFGEETPEGVRFLKIRYYRNLANFTFNTRDEFNDFLNDNKNYKIINKDKEIFKELNILNMFNNIISFQNSSNAMFHSIQSRDIVYIDLDDVNFSDGKLFLMKEGNALKIRRIKQNNPLYSNFTVTSDCKQDNDYKEYNLTGEQMGQFVFGRVISLERNIF